MEKNNINTTLAMFFVAFAVVIMTTAGLVVIPVATQEAQAANQNSESRNKGEQGEISSDCKRQGKDKKVVDECTEPPPPVAFCFTVETEEGGSATRCAPTLEICEELRAPLVGDPGVIFLSECEPRF